MTTVTALEVRVGPPSGSRVRSGMILIEDMSSRVHASGRTDRSMKYVAAEAGVPGLALLLALPPTTRILGL